jgi:hypothetical protein
VRYTNGRVSTIPRGAKNATSRYEHRQLALPHATALSCKGRLIACTVLGLTPNSLAIFRTAFGPGRLIQSGSDACFKFGGEAVEIESTRTIEIDQFVPRNEIDDRYIDSPYYIAPDGQVGPDDGGVCRV